MMETVRAEEEAYANARRDQQQILDLNGNSRDQHLLTVDSPTEQRRMDHHQLPAASSAAPAAVKGLNSFVK